jgi:TP53 regulating kinase-like protein
VVKERVVKRYRHPLLEASLSKRRLNQEVRCILRCRKNGVAAPCIYHIDYEAARIYMSFVAGTTLKAWLMALPADVEIDDKLEAVGQSLAKLHDADVVHGDLTSSNIMVSNNGP